MGIYINPADKTKEEWLDENAEVVLFPQVAFGERDSNSEAIVCLVDNGFFTAAGVIHNDRELQAFTDDNDPRPKKFFKVTFDKLQNVLTDADMREIRS